MKPYVAQMTNAMNFRRINITGTALSICLFVPMLTLSADDATGDHSALKRWAIIASQSVRDSGLSELLTVTLSETKGVELVERDQLALATRELELSNLLGAADSAKRLVLGKFVAADALVLLDLETHEDTQLLKLVIRDWKRGHSTYL